MSQLRRLLYICLLSTVFTFAALAGEMQNPGATPTPTPTPTPTESSVAGEMQNPGLAAIILDLVLALF